jgi:hypothetical protein
MSWHVDTAMGARYADGTLGDVGSSSIEAHLIACAACRAEVGQLVSATTLERLWDETAERIDAPRFGLLERLLTAIGVPSHVAKVIAVTRALQAVWLLALVGVSLLAVLVAHESPGPVPFLVLAPVVPMAGVALVFAAVTEPGEEMAVATPLGAFRMLLYRSVAVTIASFLVLAIASLTMPSAHGAALWVLPALALTAATLAAGTRFDPMLSAAVLAGAWLTLVSVLYTRASVPDEVLHRPELLLSPVVQLGALVVLSLSTLVFVARRHVVELHVR